MKKFLSALICLSALFSCVGQKDDPEPEPEEIDNPSDPVTPADPGDDPGDGGAFFRRSLVLDFTGTWCTNCPKMQTAIREACEQRTGGIVVTAVHCTVADKMYLSPTSDELVARFGISAYPSAVVDLDPSSLITVSSAELLLSHCDRLLEARGDAAGLAIASEGNSVTVEATAMKDGDYTLHLLLLEDGIVEPQLGASGDYVHNDVLRGWMDSPETFDARHAGDVFNCTFSIPASGGNMRLAALVCRGGIVDNVLTCPIGETIDYQYE